MLGDPENFTAKLLMGGGLLILLILLIWGPLLIIALLNTKTIGNSPVEVSIELSIGSFEVIDYYDPVLIDVDCVLIMYYC